MNESILDLIGNTPLVKSRLVKNPKVHLYYKLEGNNPGGSVKDRAAFYMIKNALDRGDINQDTQLIEATSGNTGIALAMIAGIFRLNIELIMPDKSTKERVQTMRAFGAKVTLTSAEKGMEGARDHADEVAEKSGAFMINQFSNPDNWIAHYKTTGPEIWNDTDGKITHFVSSMGTTGTIMGTSTYMKERNPDIQIIGVQPTDGSSIPGIRKWPQAYLPKIFNPAKVDRTIEVSEADANEMTLRLA
jgi:cysteine synthase B